MTTVTRTATEPNAATSNPMSNGSATISDQDLIALERQYWDALKDRDAETVRRLTDEDSTVAGARGVSGFTPAAIDQYMANQSYRIKGYLFNDESVRINRICDDAVAIAYEIHEDLEVDDGAVEVDAFDTSVWKRTGTGWTCVLHTESLEGDPYGRDRTPMHEAED